MKEEVLTKKRLRGEDLCYNNFYKNDVFAELINDAFYKIEKAAWS